MEEYNSRVEVLMGRRMDNKIKNILYVSAKAVLYGAERRLVDLIQNLDKEKFQPFVLLPCGGPFADKLKELGVATILLDYDFQITRCPITRFFRLTRDFIRLVRRHKIDVIHVNLHFKMSNFWLAFLILRKPVIVHLRSHYWMDIFEKFVICRTLKVICISKSVESNFLKKRRSDFFMYHRPGHTEVIYDGVDVKHFFPKPTGGKIRKEFNIGPEDFFVGLIGAVDRIKGQDILVKAAPLVVERHRCAKFIIVGDLYVDRECTNDYRDGLVKLVKTFKIENNVIFTGFRNDIDMLMNEIDLLVQPSQREALGTSMIEAMSCGKPVIGTDVDGVPEVIGNNEGGLLLNPRTPEALAEAINFFIEHPEEARQKGIRGRERVLRMFNLHENMTLIQEIYREAIG